MNFNIFTSCSGYNIKTFCKEEVVEVDGIKRIFHFCEECSKYLDEVKKDWTLK